MGEQEECMEKGVGGYRKARRKKRAGVGRRREREEEAEGEGGGRWRRRSQGRKEERVLLEPARSILP